MKVDILGNELIILDDGFYFGRGAFETILVKKKPVFLEEHINRLNKALKRLSIDKTIHVEEAGTKIQQLADCHCSVKIIASPENTLYLKRDITYTREQYEKGFNLKISEVFRNESSMMTYIKSLNYYENLIEKNKAISEGFNEAIFLNSKGFISECCTSNIFFVKNGVICTPSLECGLLDGVVRQWVIDNYKVFQGEFSLEDIYDAEEVFISNSLIGIMKVAVINKMKYERFNLTKEIQKQYLNFINK